MTISDNLFIRIRDRKASLTPVEQRVAEYILANREEIPHLSIKNLAHASKTSDASVLRFCKTMGYSGYRSFIVSISASLSAKEESVGEQYTDIQPGDELETIIANIGFNNIQSIEDTMRVIEHGAVMRAVQALRESKRIVLFGIGASGIVCQDAEQKFSRINKNCRAYTDGHGQLTAASLMTEGDVAIFVSNSGDTQEILDSLDIVQKNGVYTIAITKYNKSRLSENADAVLSISTPEISIRSGAMGSRIAMLTVIDMLFAGVASADYEQVKTYLAKSHDIISSKRKR
ncbi:MurR/RpiR family transcriptional regulator [Paenibacillus sp. 1P07SE]|uniref:MurR/RpiR family transcriptional regulator n=1 Tax=Paenibacillus sp. 1P07SE TaxID=3132209 RepID=UPI0039A6505D